MKSKGYISAIVVSSLSYVIGMLTQLGIAYTFSFVIVFATFDLLVLTFVKKRLEEIYGKSRVIHLFVYGFGSVALLVFILMLLGFN